MRTPEIVWIKSKRQSLKTPQEINWNKKMGKLVKTTKETIWTQSSK